VIVALAVIGAALLLLPGRGRAVATVALAAAVGSALLGPAAYAVDTVASARQGSIPLAGPATAGGFGPGGFRGERGDRADRGADATAGAETRATGPGGGFGPGGEGLQNDPALVGLLQSAGTKWSAATVGAMQAGPLALASGTDVMAIGGFSGGDPAPTLAQFQSYVTGGQVHYFIAGGFGGGPGGGATSTSDGTDARRGGDRSNSTISAWVEQHYTATTVGGRTVYDLTKPKA